jgi:hypothetical protein
VAELLQMATWIWEQGATEAFTGQAEIKRKTLNVQAVCCGFEFTSYMLTKARVYLHESADTSIWLVNRMAGLVIYSYVYRHVTIHLV